MPTIHYIEHTTSVYPETGLADCTESKLVYDLPNDTGVELGLVDLFVTDAFGDRFAVSSITWEHGEDRCVIYGRKLRKDGKGYRQNYNGYVGYATLF